MDTSTAQDTVSHVPQDASNAPLLAQLDAKSAMMDSSWITEPVCQDAQLESTSTMDTVYHAVITAQYVPPTPLAHHAQLD